MESIAIGEIKSHLSEYIARSSYNHDRFIITKRNKPVAALVNIDDLQVIEQCSERAGLAAVIGKWENFNEVEDAIGSIRELRKKEGLPREISF